MSYNLYLVPFAKYKLHRLHYFCQYKKPWDIMCLQELFRWNNRIRIADYPYKYSSHYPAVCTKGLVDGGLSIYSRYPIIFKEFHQYLACEYPDYLAAKGVLYCCVQLSPGKNVHVFNTHLQANSRKDTTRQRAAKKEARKRQVVEMANFVEKCTTRNTNDPILICGDLNFSENRTPDEYNHFIQQFSDNYEIDDLFKTHKDDRKRIDYIFLLKRKNSDEKLISTDCDFYNFELPAGTVFDKLSDHPCVEANLKTKN